MEWSEESHARTQRYDVDEECTWRRRDDEARNSSIHQVNERVVAFLNWIPVAKLQYDSAGSSARLVNLSHEFKYLMPTCGDGRQNVLDHDEALPRTAGSQPPVGRERAQSSRAALGCQCNGAEIS